MGSSPPLAIVAFGRVIRPQSAIGQRSLNPISTSWSPPHGAVTLRKGDEIIGCSRFYPVPDRPGAIGIGFTFITCQHWGGSANQAIKTLMTDHAFSHVPEVWFHIAPTNIRSQKATAKLGATFEYQATLDLGTGPTDWMCYRLRHSS